MTVLALASMSCGPAVNGAWKGPPLVTLTGQLSLQDGVVLEQGVRLAIAWFPNLSGDSPVAPRAIATEEVEYTGTFPQRFSFPLHGPPAREALEVVVADDGTQGEAAVGQLLAYEDLDGDGKLSVDSAGKSSDRILGSAAGAWPFDFFSQGQRDLVTWVKRPDDLGLGRVGMKPGYNLLRFDSPLKEPTVLPLDTPVPLRLTGDPRLQLIVCPEAYASRESEQACGVKVWSTPPVSGALTLRDDGDFDLFLSVESGAQRVQVNGVEVPPMGPDRVSFSEAFTAASNAVHVGVNTLTVEATGYAPLTLEVTVPSRFDVLSPAPGARLTPGGPVRLSWTAALGATIYGPNVFVGEHAAGDVTPELAIELRVPQSVGPGEVNITAFDRFGFGRTSVMGLSVRSVPVVVGP